VVLLEDAAVLVVGRGADAADLAVGQHRLDEVGGVHHAAGGGAGANDGVDLIDEQNRAGSFFSSVITPFEALLEIAAYFGAGDQGRPCRVRKWCSRTAPRHLALDDQAREAFGDRGFADAGFTDVEGLFFLRRHRISMVRSTSSLRPMSGSMRPSAPCD